MENNTNEQSLKQKKIALAQSEHASIIIELIKDCMPQNPIVAETQWATIVNAVTLEANSNLILRMVELLKNIREGSLHDPK